MGTYWTSYVCTALLLEEEEEELLEREEEEEDDDEEREDEELAAHCRITQPQRLLVSISHDGPPVVPSAHFTLGISGAGPQSCGVHTNVDDVEDDNPGCPYLALAVIAIFTVSARLIKSLGRNVPSIFPSAFLSPESTPSD